MIVRPWTQFTTDLPDDSTEDDKGFVQWPGKGVTLAIAEMMTRRGYTVDGPYDLEHAGWELGIARGKCYLWMRVAEIYTFTLVFKQCRSIFGGRPRVQPEYLQALNDLNDELINDDRFHCLGWFTDFVSDPVIVGAKTPVEGELVPAKTFGFLRKWLFRNDPVR